MNQADLIEKAIQEMYSRENDYKEAWVSFADAEHEYRMAKAKAYLKASGTVDERKAKADLEVSAYMKAKLTAEAALELTKAKLLDVRQAVSARQSILSSEVKNAVVSNKWTA